MSSGPKTFLYISFVSLPIFDREFSFLFCFPPFSLIGIFLFLLFSSFLLFSLFFCFLLRARFMVSWDFGSRLVERKDMIYVRVWFGSGIKGNVPHYFHDTNATMMIWKFYAKLVMHAPMRTLKRRKIFGHVMLGLIIHFLYFSQPTVSKICSFINIVHSSEPILGVRENFHSIHPSSVYTHFQKLVMINEFFSSNKS